MEPAERKTLPKRGAISESRAKVAAAATPSLKVSSSDRANRRFCGDGRSGRSATAQRAWNSAGDLFT